MGYSVEAAFIRPCLHEKDFATFVNNFTTVNHSFKKQLQFEEARKGEKNAIYIGNYNGCTVFFYEGMLNGKKTELGLALAEQMTIDLNKNGEILFIQNEESACGYYYHLVVNGKTIRRKEGAEGELSLDEGQELPLEKECYHETSINDDNETIYKVWWERGQRFEEYKHYELGGSIAFNLCKDFIGFRFEDFPADLTMSQFLEDETNR